MWRSPHRKALLVSHAAVAVAYVPWLPFMRGSSLDVIGKLSPLSFHSASEAIVRVLVGAPFSPLREVPGRAGLVAGALAVAVAVAASGILILWVRHRRFGRARNPRGQGLPTLSIGSAGTHFRVLLATGLALATPVGLLAYFALTHTDIYGPRYLIASMPAMFVAIAMLLTARRTWWCVAAIALGLLTSVLGTISILQPTASRPQLKQAARFIEQRAQPGDVIMHEFLPIAPPGPLRRDIEIYIHKPLTVRSTATFKARGTIYGAAGDLRAWRAGNDGARVFVVGPVFGGAMLPRPPARYHLTQVASRQYSGIAPIHVVEYARARAG